MAASKAVLFLSLLALAVSSPSQTGDFITVPPASQAELAIQQDGIEAIFSTPPTIPLIQHTPEAHPGNIWLRSSPEGLHIWGTVQVDQNDIHSPLQKSEILSSDHIEVWLATATSVPMPTIGFGNQFGPVDLANLNDCSDQNDSHTGDAEGGARNCQRWYNEQLQYRQSLQRLFTRQWLIAATDTWMNNARIFEDFASSAYTALSATLFNEDLPVTLKPKPIPPPIAFGQPPNFMASAKSGEGPVAQLASEVRPEVHHDAAGNASNSNHLVGYRFHVLIPYAAFPPTQQLKLSDLYLMVDVFAAAPEGRKMGAYSTTSASREWGKPATFNHLRLANPRTFSITPCEAKPEQANLYGEKFTPWYFPTQSADSTLKSTFALINPAGGYMYDPGGVSPDATTATYFWKQLKDGGTICGPTLAWHKGDTIKRTDFTIDEKTLTTKTLTDGWTLLRSGPTTSTQSPFGSGQCGSCPVVGFDIYAISPQGEITQALNIEQDLSGEGGNPDDADLAISPDWNRITLFTHKEDDQTPPVDLWTSTPYCLEGHAYKQCGEPKPAKPPNPRSFPDLNNPS